MEKRDQYVKKCRLVLVLAAACVVGMIGASWAYWSQEHTVANEFELGKYSTGIIEEFEPPANWTPGSEVNKDVEIENDGTVPVYVRVVISQEWLRRENIYDQAGNPIAPLAGEPFPLRFAAAGGEAYAAQIGWGDNVVLLSPGASRDRSPLLGLPIVSDPGQAQNQWLLTSEAPDADGNYTAYYMGILKGGESTPRLIDNVRMHPDIQATFLAEHTVWDKEKEVWVTTQEKNPAHGYENAHYTLGVTMYTVQATKAALEEMFSADTAGEQRIVAGLQELAEETRESRFPSDTEKKLYFKEKDGLMRYTPVMDGTSWFMSHLNMMPGDTYEDRMLIENLSSKSYDLYLQVVPRDQEPLPQELLEYIYMKVFQGDKMIYDGTALGKSYAESVADLQQVVLLGEYEPGREDMLRVELMLDKDTPMEYAGILSNIDWKFMVEDIPSETPPEQIIKEEPVRTDPVKTGDRTNLMWYTILMGIAGSLLACCAWYGARLYKQRKILEDNAPISS